MRSSFEPRVVPPPIVALIRDSQAVVRCHLGGGAALSGAYLAHRLSADVDLICHDAGDLRALVAELPGLARGRGLDLVVVRNGGAFVRARLDGVPGIVRVDVTHEPSGDLELPPPAIEGVIVESLADLRAAKITCLLSRSEPRDLVDLLFLDRAGHPPDRDLALALRKDAGIDPGVLAWLLGQFPLRPLPSMLEPLSEIELRLFRDDLRERLRVLALPPPPAR